MDLTSTGLYTTNEITEVGLIGKALEEYNKDTILRKITALKSSGESLATTKTQEPSFGVYVKDNKLKIDGRVIAHSNEANPEIYETDSTNFSDVSIAPHRKCINITLENYNKLRKGQVVQGYKIYDKYAIYNIVQNANNASDVYCELTGHTDLIYASVVGNVLPENEVSTNTFTMMDAPTLVMRDYELRVQPNQSLELQYYVDTRRSEALYENNYGETFTTIVKDEDGSILSKLTTYAGELYTSITLKRQLQGPTWFSILCIDSRGVESPILYFDVFIDELEWDEPYVITNQDLEEHKIKIHLDNEQGIDLSSVEMQKEGYLNRLGLTKLFKDLKLHHNNVVFPENIYGRTMKIFIELRKNINTEFNYDTLTGEINFGTKRYYYATIKHEEPRVVNNNVVGSKLTLTEILRNQPDDPNYNDGNYIVAGKDPVDYILEDPKKLYRDHNDKIKVIWGSQYLTNNEVTNTNNPFHVESLQRLTKPKAIKIDDQYYYPPAYILEEEDKQLYVVDSSVYFEGNVYTADDPITFPNDFTVNFSGIQFIAIPTPDITKGVVMSLRANRNTHIIGGKDSKKGEIIGMYKKIDFKRAFVEAAYWNPGEFLKNWGVSSALFCSVKNIKSSYSLGYDGSVGMSALVNCVVDDNKQPTKILFKHMGYIGYDGNINNTTLPVSELSSNSSDRSIASHINLVYTDPVYCKFIYNDPIQDQNLYTSDLFIGPLGYGKYLAGKQHEIFVSFYKKSGDNYNWISTIKTHQYYLIKIPPLANYFRVCGYGISKKIGNTYQAVVDSNGNNRAFPYLFYEGLVISKNVLYLGCGWSHTRTVGMTVSYAKAITIDNCNYTLMAIESSKNGFGVTQMLGDFEEGWEHTDRVTIKNCQVYAGYSSTYHVFGSVYLLMNCGRNLVIMNNRTPKKDTSLSLLELGGFESAYICNNVFSSGQIRRRTWYEHPCIVYKDNEYRDNLELSEFNSDVLNYVNSEGHRVNRCDDPILDKVTIRGSIIPNITRDLGVALKVKVEDSNIAELEIVNGDFN